MIINKLPGGHSAFLNKAGQVNWIKLRQQIFFVLRCFGRITLKDACIFFEDVVQLLKEAEKSTPEKTTTVKSKKSVAKGSSEETAVEQKTECL